MNRLIHLINPKTDSLTTRPMYLGRALYSPLAGLLAVAGVIPRDRYEVVLTDENIEPIDFDLKANLVGISAMTCYVNRGYEIAEAFRDGACPWSWEACTPSFMPQEALQHCRRRRGQRGGARDGTCTFRSGAGLLTRNLSRRAAVSHEPAAGCRDTSS